MQVTQNKMELCSDAICVLVKHFIFDRLFKSDWKCLFVFFVCCRHRCFSTFGTIAIVQRAHTHTQIHMGNVKKLTDISLKFHRQTEVTTNETHTATTTTDLFWNEQSQSICLTKRHFEAFTSSMIEMRARVSERVTLIAREKKEPK